MVDQATTLERLAMAFTARDIMTSEDRLVSAADRYEALHLLQTHREFDVLPLRSAGRLTAYLERGAGEPKTIEPKDIISEATSILHLVDYLQRRKFYFVLVERDVTGYVHYSDLNHHIVRLPFFLLFNALEEYLANRVGSLVTERNLSDILDTDRAQQLLERLSKQKKADSNLYLADLLSLRQLLQYAQYFEIVALSREQQQALVMVRNRIAHPARPLVTAPGDVSALVKAHNTCVRVLEWGIGPARSR